MVYGVRVCLNKGLDGMGVLGEYFVIKFSCFQDYSIEIHTSIPTTILFYSIRFFYFIIPCIMPSIAPHSL